MNTVLTRDSSNISGYRLTAFLVLTVTFIWLISYWPAPLGDTDATSNPAVALKTLTIQAWGDSWRPMTEALSHIRSGDLTPIYTEFLISQSIKFQYSLTSLIPFSWLQAFAEATGIDFLHLAVAVLRARWQIQGEVHPRRHTPAQNSNGWLRDSPRGDDGFATCVGSTITGLWPHAVSAGRAADWSCMRNSVKWESDPLPPPREADGDRPCGERSRP